MCCSIHHGRFRRKLIVISVRGQWILWSRELLTNSSRSYSDHWEYENSHRIKRVYFFHAVHLGIVFIHTFYFLKQATKQKRIHVQNCGGTFKIIFRDFTFFLLRLNVVDTGMGFSFLLLLNALDAFMSEASAPLLQRSRKCWSVVCARRRAEVQYLGWEMQKLASYTVQADHASFDTPYE